MQITSACLDILNQLQQVVEQIKPEDFSRKTSTLNASVGQHLRHTLEFFLCLEKGTAEGVINYDKRNHDVLIEEDKFIALATIGKIAEFVKSNAPSKPLLLEIGYNSHNDACEAIPTTFLRELTYNIEHAVHHMAIMKIGLREVAPYLRLPENFGVAVSTVRHRHAQNHTMKG